MTLRYVYGEDAPVARFVAQLIPHIDRGFPSDAKAIGITNAEGIPLAGIVFYHWIKTAGTTEVAIAGRTGFRWFSRETIFRLYDYAFTARACQMVIMKVRADNRSLLCQMKAFGCKTTPVERLYGRADDGVICTYTVEQWAASKFNRPPVARPQEEAA
jgi:hypothetical protein